MDPLRRMGRLRRELRQVPPQGIKAFVEGRIQTREWNDKDGNKRYTTEIVANSVQFLDSKGSGGQRQEPARDEKPGGGFDDDSIPF